MHAQMLKTMYIIAFNTLPDPNYETLMSYICQNVNDIFGDTLRDVMQDITESAKISQPDKPDILSIYDAFNAASPSIYCEFDHKKSLVYKYIISLESEQISMCDMRGATAQHSFITKIFSNDECNVFNSLVKCDITKL